MAEEGVVAYYKMSSAHVDINITSHYNANLFDL